jgi:hypothetical protein
MQEWEYLVANQSSGKIDSIDQQPTNRESRKTTVEFLKERGNEGWELVAVTRYDDYYETFYFKRKKILAG